MSLKGGIGRHGNPGGNPGLAELGLPDWINRSWWVLPALIFGVLWFLSSGEREEGETEEKELGAVLYEKDGEVKLGPIVEGTRHSVNIPMECPDGAKLRGFIHTHPGGSLFPSAQDMETAQRLNLPAFIQANGETIAYLPKKPN